jgi:hypothetical protein
MFWNFFSYHEAPLMFYHKIFIYHIDAMGHEVCILFYMVVVVTITKKGISMSQECMDVSWLEVNMIK